MKVGFWSAKGKEIPIDPDWKKLNKSTYQSVIRFLQDPDRSVPYKGLSSCRICKKFNGSEECTNDGIIYPYGYIHYIKDHGVVPDDAVISAATRGGY